MQRDTHTGHCVGDLPGETQLSRELCVCVCVRDSRPVLGHPAADWSQPDPELSAPFIQMASRPVTPTTPEERYRGRSKD